MPSPKSPEFTMQDLDAELDAITALAGLDWEADDPLAVTIEQWAEHVGLGLSAAQRRLELLAAEGKMRMTKRRRLTVDGKWRIVKTWRRVT